jgi:hypothetical protein
MSSQPHEHEGPPTQRVVQVPDVPILADWDHADCAICVKPATEPVRGMTPQPREELRGEALRRAWLNASYQAGAKEVPAVSVHEYVVALMLGALCWAIIGAGVWLVWRMF